MYECSNYYKRTIARMLYGAFLMQQLKSNSSDFSWLLTNMWYFCSTVVSCVMNTSHGMYSCVNKREDVKRSIVISLGAIDVDIPQHPVALHCMMTRSSKTLSKQLSEIQSQRSVMRYLIFNMHLRFTEIFTATSTLNPVYILVMSQVHFVMLDIFSFLGLLAVWNVHLLSSYHVRKMKVMLVLLVTMFPPLGRTMLM